MVRLTWLASIIGQIEPVLQKISQGTAAIPAVQVTIPVIQVAIPVIQVTIPVIQVTIPMILFRSEGSELRRVNQPRPYGSCRPCPLNLPSDQQGQEFSFERWHLGPQPP